MWFRSLFPGPNRATRRATRQPQPRISRSLGLERLEDLCLPSFLSPVNYAIGANPQAVVSADFNNDGRKDLAFANPFSGTVSVLAGNADGTFQSAVSSNAGGGAVSLAAGDFNADGKLDLVTADNVNVMVLLGNGDGAFQPPTAFGTGSGLSPVSVAVGDFNADGKLDLGVASSTFYPGGWGYWGYYPGFYISQATVMLGTGTGSFSNSSTVDSAFGGSAAAAVADINNDGKLDLVLGGSSNYNGTISVHLGTGTGTLGTALNSYAPGFYASVTPSLALGDVNGDGKFDIVTSNAFQPNVPVLLGDGLGGFSYDSARVYATDSYPLSVALADFNGDGTLDLAAMDTGGSVNVLLGAGGGVFRPPVVVSTTAGTPLGVVVGDFNGDGRQDVATANANSGNSSVLLNDGVWPALSAPLITVNDVTVTEGNTGTTAATFTVSLSASSSQTVTVRYATQDGSATAAGNDYQPASGLLTFAPGVTTQTVTVPVIGDRVGESNESFVIAFTDPTNAFLADARGNGTIVDDEPVASIDYGPVTVTEGNSGATNAVFTVRLAAAYDAPVSVNYSTFEGDTDFPSWGVYGYYPAPPAATAGSDFQSNAGAVTFAPGETVKTIVVAVNGDVLGEDSEYFSVNLTDSPDATLTGRHAVGIITDDEPRVSIGEASVTEGNSGTKAMTFTVTLSASSSAPVTVTYATADASATTAGGDYQAKTGSLTFAPGETTKTITVLVNGDRLGEYDESLYVNLTGASGAALSNIWGQGLILDDEARLSISNASITEGNKGTKLMTFTVSLAAPYDQTVTVKFATYDWSTTAGIDYVAKSGTLTFLPGEIKKTITITIKGDTKREGDETFMVALENPSSNALVYVGSGWGTILDDDSHGRKR